jgi:predicted membrane protein
MGRRNNFNTIFWGLVLVLVGALFLAQNLGYLDNFPFWNYLPALLIVLGLYQLFVNQFRAWAGPLILILIGTFLLLAALDFITWATFGTLIWPTILILVGLSIIFRRGSSSENFVEEKSSQFNIFSAFNAQKRNVTSPDFRHGEITAMFGGVEVDFRNANIMEKPVRIQSTVMFGGADIFVPQDWDVRIDAFAMFGGTEDKRRPAALVKQTPDLIVSGTILFGGLNIKA